MKTSFEIPWATFKQIIQAGSSFREVDNIAFYTLVIVDSSVVFNCVVDKNSPEQTEYEASFRSLKKPIKDSSTVLIASQPPFAEPTFRTKWDATPQVITMEANQEQVIDFQLPEELYVNGGEIVFSGTKVGDYVKGSIVDSFGLIPEAYRPFVAENYPTIAEYLKKHYLSEGVGFKAIQTYPLNARVTQGLVLRVTLFTCAKVGTREFAMNYYLTKKL